ncbi:hypothetical protein O181_132996 [Austropuccinia psidii MF-1]|uniref:Uncharacterized protein n=1 Tax=Austropuccinia psidii MF-1 TaxID=1389203 RepID=A0A9Q3L6U8_9BASI|nr:hypothetical protein [Austropuccinia psidii MF-1]
MQVLEMLIILEPELEDSMSNPRKKLHSESSNRHINEPVQTVPHSLQRKGLGNITPNPSRSNELLPNPQEIPSSSENSEILQWMEFKIIQNSNQTDKLME